MSVLSVSPDRVGKVMNPGQAVMAAAAAGGGLEGMRLIPIKDKVGLAGVGT